MNPIGVMVNNLDPDWFEAIRTAGRLGFPTIHTRALPESWLAGEGRRRLVSAIMESGLTLASMFVGFEGQSYADIPTIRRTVGLAVRNLRQRRKEVAWLYGPLAGEAGAQSLSGHLGFIPERSHPDYSGLVEVVRELVDSYAEHGLGFNLETGQDPAPILHQFLQDVGRPSLGVNLDPANFILYGSDDPLRALEILWPFVRGVHCKDAVGSGGDEVLGQEVPLGTGKVDFPLFLRKLRDFGYQGPLVIERESGENPVGDILTARTYLEKLLGKV